MKINGKYSEDHFLASNMINEYFISSIQDIIPNSNISDPNSLI